MSDSYIIVVKDPNHVHDDYEFTVPRRGKVMDLKLKLREKWDIDVSEQRLVYRGAELKENNADLRDIFSVASNDGKLFLHCVPKTPVLAPRTSPKTTPVTQRTPTTPTAATTPTPTPTSSTTTTTPRAILSPLDLSAGTTPQVQPQQQQQQQQAQRSPVRSILNSNSRAPQTQTTPTQTTPTQTPITPTQTPQTTPISTPQQTPTPNPATPQQPSSFIAPFPLQLPQPNIPTPNPTSMPALQPFSFPNAFLPFPPPPQQGNTNDDEQQILREATNVLFTQHVICSAAAAAAANSFLLANVWQNNPQNHKTISPTSDLPLNNNNNNNPFLFSTPQTTTNTNFPSSVEGELENALNENAAEENTRQNQQQNQPQPQEPQEEEGVIQADLRVIIRLAVLVLIFTQGRSRDKLPFFLLGAFLCFLHLTGRLQFLWNLVDISGMIHRLQRPGALLDSQNRIIENEIRNQDGHALNQDQQSRVWRFFRHIGISFLAYFLTLNPNWDPVAAIHAHED